MNNNEFDYREFRDQFQLPALAKTGVIPILIGLIFLFTSWFTVSPEEVGIVLRFGEYVRTAEPGLNFKIPFGVEDVYKVPIQRQLKQEFGYRTEKAGIKSTYSRGNFEQESLMLTGDLNTAEVEWSVQYRISDPYKYLFKVRGQHQTMRMMNESIMREVVGDRTVNEVLTIGRQEVASMVEVKLQELCDQYDTGFKVDQVVLQDVNPPDKVKPSFNAVNEAQQERERLINEARAKYNQIIPKAKGEAKQLVQQAEGYALDRVNSARGDSAKFVDVLDEYKKAPEVTRQRIYLETLNRILPKAGRKVIIDKDAANVIPLLQLDSNSYSNSSDKGRQK